MIRYIIFLLSSFIVANTFAQCDYVKNEVDKFTDTEIKKTKDFLIWADLEKSYSISLFKNSHKTGVSKGFYLTYKHSGNYGSTRCFSSDAEIIMLLGDKSKVQIKTPSNKIDCDNKFLMTYFYLSDEDIEKLENANLTAIRIYFSEGYEDFDIKSKNSTYFIENLACIK